MEEFPVTSVAVVSVLLFPWNHVPENCLFYNCASSRLLTPVICTLSSAAAIALKSHPRVHISFYYFNCPIPCHHLQPLRHAFKSRYSIWEGQTSAHALRPPLFCVKGADERKPMLTSTQVANPSGLLGRQYVFIM